nr:MAG TPA: hypothetical protein [Caudoviricetes sp.]
MIIYKDCLNTKSKRFNLFVINTFIENYNP